MSRANLGKVHQDGDGVTQMVVCMCNFLVIFDLYQLSALQNVHTPCIICELDVKWTIFLMKTTAVYLFVNKINKILTCHE